MTQQPYPPPAGQPDPRQWQGYGQQPPPPPAKKRRWPWIVGGVVLFLFVVGTLAGPPDPAPAPAAPPVPSVAAAPTFAAPTYAPPAAAQPSTPAPKRVTLPEVKGKNGAIVYEELQDLGLTNVQFASRDQDDQVVVLPANWTAVKIEPGAGTEIMSNRTVVVTMTKN